jgi:hypothetical protein
MPRKEPELWLQEATPWSSLQYVLSPARKDLRPAIDLTTEHSNRAYERQVGQKNWYIDPYALKLRVDDTVAVPTENRVIGMIRFGQPDSYGIDNESFKDLRGVKVVSPA